MNDQITMMQRYEDYVLQQRLNKVPLIDGKVFILRSSLDSDYVSKKISKLEKEINVQMKGE